MKRFAIACVATGLILLFSSTSRADTSTAQPKEKLDSFVRTAELQSGESDASIQQVSRRRYYGYSSRSYGYYPRYSYRPYSYSYGYYPRYSYGYSYPRYSYGYSYPRYSGYYGYGYPRYSYGYRGYPGYGYGGYGYGGYGYGGGGVYIGRGGISIGW